MSELPPVSIVIPVYNGSNYLRAAIESALDQTYPHVEVIVVNDGSTDSGATRMVAETFGGRIRYMEKPNGGVASALNAGIAAMRGELFSWLSHDDLYRPWKVERQVEVWRSFGPRCVVIGDFETMDEHENPLDLVAIGAHNLVARPLDAVFHGMINGCTLLVPRALLREVGEFEPGLPTTQDYHLWYRLARIVPFVHCAGAGVRQRIHEAQGSRQYSHLDEASRMFAHLIESTPSEVMCAYEGSELRFLLRLRQRLGGVYPGLNAYLDRRIAEAYCHFSYVVVWTTRPADPAAAESQVAGYHPPPARIAEACTADPAEASRFGQPSETIAFLPPDRLPSPAQFHAALETFVLSDADAARPRGAPAWLGPADGVIARCDTLSILANELSSVGIGAGGLTVAEYPAVPNEEDLATAFAPMSSREQGRDIRTSQPRTAVEYHSYLCASDLTRALAARLRPERPAILFLSHSIGGGTWTHLNRLAATIAPRVDCLIGLGEPGGSFRLRKFDPGEPALRASEGGGILFNLPRHAVELAHILRAIGVVRADVHSIYGFEAGAEALLHALGLPLDVTMLDYHLVADDPHLRLRNGRFIERARPDQPPLLRAAERAFAVSRDMVARLRTLCPLLETNYAPPWPEAKGRVSHVFRPVIRDREALRVVLIGPLVPHKGSHVIIEAAHEVHRRGLPVVFHHLGATELSPADQADLPPSLITHGEFDPDTLSKRLNGIAPHLGWLPSRVPETWCYALSEFKDACLPVAASAIGALVERCHGRPATWLLPWDALAQDWVDLFVQLHATRLQHPPLWAPIDHLPSPQPVSLDEYLRPSFAAAAKRNGPGLEAA